MIVSRHSLRASEVPGGFGKAPRGSVEKPKAAPYDSLYFTNWWLA